MSCVLAVAENWKMVDLTVYIRAFTSLIVAGFDHTAIYIYIPYLLEKCFCFLPDSILGFNLTFVIMHLLDYILLLTLVYTN